MFAGFCPNCGAPMKTEFLGVCPYCGYDVVDDELGEYIVCPMCGEYIEKDISGEFPDICPVCGSDLGGDSDYEKAYVNEKASSTVASTAAARRGERKSEQISSEPVHQTKPSKPVLNLSKCDKRDRKYGVVLWALLALLVVFTVFFFALDVFHFVPMSLFASCIILMIGLFCFGYLHHKVSHRSAGQSLVSFWIIVCLVFPLLLYGSYAMGQTYFGREPAYAQALAHAERGEWAQGKAALYGYSEYNDTYKAVYNLCWTMDYLENGVGQPSVIHVEDLPDELKDVGRQAEDEMANRGRAQLGR